MEWSAGIVTALPAWLRRMFSKPTVQIIVKDRGTLNVIQGDQHNHYHVKEADVIVPRGYRVLTGSAEFQAPPPAKLTQVRSKDNK